MRTSSALMEEAKEQPALGSGIYTFLPGFTNKAVSAINFTPQNKICLALVEEAIMLNPSESPTKSTKPPSSSSNCKSAGM